MLTDRRNLWLIIVFLLIVPGVFWGLPSALTPQVDAPSPLGPLLFFAEFKKSDLNTTYPAFHQMLVLPFYAIAFVVYWLAGGISKISSAWPYGLRDVSGFFSVLIVISNLIAAAMGTLLLRCTFPFVEKERKWLWFSLLMVGANGTFIYYARTGNLDMPYNFWLAVAWFFLWRYLIEDRPILRSLVPAGIAAACAVGSKDQAAGMIVGTALLLLLIGPQRSTALSQRLSQTALFGSVVAITYAIVAIVPQPARWWNHARFVVSPHAPTKIPLSVAGEIDILGVTFGRLLAVFTWPVMALCILGIAVLFLSGRGRQVWLLSVPMVGYYVVIIGMTRVAYPRFMIPFVFAVVVLATHGVAFIAGRLAGRSGAQLAWTVLLASFLIYRFAFSYLPVTYAQVFDLKRDVTRDLPSFVSPGSPLLISHMQSYEYPNSDIYSRYHLMKLPHEPIIPASRHTASIFHELDLNVPFYLLGTGTAGLPSNTPAPSMPLQGELVKQWRYPDWVRNRVMVPCIFEFALYRRTEPLPVDYVPPTYITSGLQ
jgi:hypothetical protein